MNAPAACTVKWNGGGSLRGAATATGLCVLAALGGCTQGDGDTGSTTVPAVFSTTSASPPTAVESSVVTPTAVSVATTDATSLPPQVGLLSGWPPAPVESMALEGAPYLLPTVDIEARSIELSTIDLSSAIHTEPSFMQEYAVAGGEMFAWIETTVGLPPVVPSDSTPLTVGAWISARLVENAMGSSVVLSDASGGVTVSVVGSGESSRVALLIASSLVRRSDGEAGWIMQPVEGTSAADRDLLGLATLVSDGWNFGVKQRTTEWIGADSGPVLEILVVVGRPQLALRDSASVPSLVDGFAGAQAISQVIPDRGSLVAWSPTRGVTITVVTRDSVAETLRVAQSVSVVTQKDWEASGMLLPPLTEVGCDYFFVVC